MLNIEHLLMKQRCFALEEISTVFLAIGFAQYTIYHFKYRKYKNSAIAKVIDYEEKYYDKEDYYVYMPVVQFTNNQNQKIQSILNIELDEQEYPFGKEIAIKYNDNNLEYVLKDGYISKMVNSRNRINEKIIFLHVSNTEEICDLMHSFLD